MFNIISLLIRYSNSFILNNYWSRVWVVCWNGISWGWTIFTLDAQKSFFYRLFCFLLYGLSSVLLLNIWGKRFEKAKNKESRCWPREVESDWQISHNADHLYMYILSHCDVIESPSRSSPSFTLKPKNFTRMQHSAVTFECQAVGTPNANYKLGEIYK